MRCVGGDRSLQDPGRCTGLSEVYGMSRQGSCLLFPLASQENPYFTRFLVDDLLGSLSEAGMACILPDSPAAVISAPFESSLGCCAFPSAAPSWVPPWKGFCRSPGSSFLPNFLRPPIPPCLLCQAGTWGCWVRTCGSGPSPDHPTVRRPQHCYPSSCSDTLFLLQACLCHPRVLFQAGVGGWEAA